MDNKQEKALEALVSKLDKEPGRADLPPPKHFPPETPGDDVREADLPDPEEDEEESSEDGPVPQEAEQEKSDRLAQAQKAFEDDDVDEALMLAFNKTPEELGVENADWVNVRRAKKAVRETKKKIIAHGEALEKKYGPAVGASEAFAAGDYAKFADIVELLTGEAYEVASVKILRALGKQYPKAEAVKRAAPKDEVKAAVDSELSKAHPVRKLEDWADKVKAVLEETADDDGDPTMTAKAAADYVLAEERKAAKDKLALLDDDAPATKPRGKATSGANKRKMSLEDLVAEVEKMK